VKHVPVHVVAQPELLPLIYSSPRKEEHRNEKKNSLAMGFIAPGPGARKNNGQ
jgi:hypothetical protein